MGEVLKIRFETLAEFDGNGSRAVMANVDALVRKDRRWIRSDVSGGFGIRWLAGDCQAEHSSATKARRIASHKNFMCCCLGRYWIGLMVLLGLYVAFQLVLYGAYVELPHFLSSIFVKE